MLYHKTFVISLAEPESSINCCKGFSWGDHYSISQNLFKNSNLWHVGKGTEKISAPLSQLCCLRIVAEKLDCPSHDVGSDEDDGDEEEEEEEDEEEEEEEEVE